MGNGELGPAKERCWIIELIKVVLEMLYKGGLAKQSRVGMLDMDALLKSVRHGYGRWNGVLVVDLRQADYLLHDEYAFEEMLRLLPLAQQNGLLGKRSAQDRVRALANRLLQLVGGMLLMADVEPRRSVGQFGKPLLDGLAFNMSNGEDIVGMFLCHDFDGTLPAVGLDIAHVNDYHPDLLDANIFAAEERSLLSRDEPSRLFAHLWSLKECYVKFLGHGLHYNDGNLSTLDFSTEVHLLRFHKRLHSQELTFASRWLDDQIITTCYPAVASFTDPPIYMLHLEDLVNYLNTL